MMKGSGKALQKPNSNCIFLRVVAKGISFLLWDIPEGKKKKQKFTLWINPPAKKLILLPMEKHTKKKGTVSYRCITWMVSINTCIWFSAFSKAAREWKLA